MDIVLLCVFPIMVAFGASSDLVTMTIPNRLSLVMIAGFVLVAILIQMPLATFGMHLAAGITMLAISFCCFALGGCGGGDAKLAAAVALWFGFSDLLNYVLNFMLLGGTLGIGILYWRTLTVPLFLMKIHWIQRLHNSKAGVPYGIALGMGALMMYPETAIWNAIAHANV